MEVGGLGEVAGGGAAGGERPEGPLDERVAHLRGPGHRLAEQVLGEIAVVEALGDGHGLAERIELVPPVLRG